ncbi:GmrSD restriction endonuclease domain-containing protein [Stomatohabitans albus]|uniref:GmrSD restriction endonuclease domain-containing protein n=1 Tax=Stomatohabitans albus TaxID=3110766 RepID=UPI00300C202F
MSQTSTSSKPRRSSHRVSGIAGLALALVLSLGSISTVSPAHAFEQGSVHTMALTASTAQGCDARDTHQPSRPGWIPPWFWSLIEPGGPNDPCQSDELGADHHMASSDADWPHDVPRPEVSLAPIPEPTPTWVPRTPEIPGPEQPQDPTPEPDPEGDAPEPPTQPQGQIANLLASLETRPKDYRRRYQRSEFGQGWADIDGNHCNTRNDILARDLRNVRKRGHCKVLSGILNGPYSGRVIHFQSGRYTSAKVQIDHVVALKDAWLTGAQNLDKERRIHLMNDPLNLLAVDGPANGDKGYKNAAEWLPPNEQFHCHYVARQIAVKARYHLWVTPQEHDTMAGVLAGCPPMRVENDSITDAG